jgi:hypothetical protein
MVLNGISRIYFHFCSKERRVKKGIPRVCFYFCSTERNSELFSLPRKGLEWNSENFLFSGTAGITLEINICSVYSVFSGVFGRKFSTLSLGCSAPSSMYSRLLMCSGGWDSEKKNRLERRRSSILQENSI